VKGPGLLSLGHISQKDNWKCQLGLLLRGTPCDGCRTCLVVDLQFLATICQSRLATTIKGPCEGAPFIATSTSRERAWAMLDTRQKAVCSRQHAPSIRGSWGGVCVWRGLLAFVLALKK
jgi:hypothetical protein